VQLGQDPVVSTSSPSIATSGTTSFSSVLSPVVIPQSTTGAIRPVTRDPRLANRDPRLQGRGPLPASMLPLQQPEEPQTFTVPVSTTLPPFSSAPVMIDVAPMMMPPGLPPPPSMMPPPGMYPPPGGMLLRPPPHTNLVPSVPPHQIGMIQLPTNMGPKPIFPGI